ncbi:MAG: hypothetical protein ACFCGT_24730 [Sandaracinaceae bacterium]
MRRLVWCALLGVALMGSSTLPGGPLRAPVAQAQVVPESLVWSVFLWELSTPNGGSYGHVIVRGPSAPALPGYGLAADREEWFVAGLTSAAPAAFTLELEMVAASQDLNALSALVQSINAQESLMGETLGIPPWDAGTLPSSGDLVFVLDDVANSSGNFGEVIGAASVSMPSDPQAPSVPVFYVTDDALSSIFGSATPDVGAVASFVPVGPNDPGYPGSGWYGYGG